MLKPAKLKKLTWIFFVDCHGEQKMFTCSIRSRCSWHLLLAERWLFVLSLTSCSSSVLTTSLTLQSSRPGVEPLALICSRSRTLAMASFCSFTRISLETKETSKNKPTCLHIGQSQWQRLNVTYSDRNRCSSTSADLLTPWEVSALSSARRALTSFCRAAGSGLPT